jgi:hypothetical protein
MPIASELGSAPYFGEREMSEHTERSFCVEWQLEAHMSRRDDLLLQLWTTYKDMSDLIDPEEFDSADLELWELVTRNKDIQSRLG